MTDTRSARWIEIDDSDPSVEYSGEWFSDSYTNPGPFQAPGDLNQGTARGTNSTARLSLRYEGGNVGIWGSSSLLPTSANIRCTLDGVEVENGPNGGDFRERWLLCFAGRLVEGPHQLVMEVTITDGTIIWVDNFSYFSVNPDLRNKRSEVPVENKAVQWIGAGWQSHSSGVDGGQMTNTEGSRVFFPFYGTSIELRGFLEPNMPQTPSFATFSIDNGPETPFTLPTYTNNFRGLNSGASRYRVSVLHTPSVPNGAHNISITHHGNSTSTPLAIDYFMVAHDESRVNPSTGVGTPLSPGGGTTTNPPTTNVSQQSTNTGAIVGGVVGGVAFLAIVAILAFCFWRRRKRKDYSAVAPSPFEPAPIPVAPPSWASTPLSAHEGQGKVQGPYYSIQSSPGRPSFQYTPVSGSSQQLSSLAPGQIAPFASSPMQPLQYPPTKSAGGSGVSLPVGVLPPGNVASGSQMWQTQQGGMSMAPGIIFQPVREPSFPPLDPPPPISPLQRDPEPYVRLDGHSKRDLAQGRSAASQVADPQQGERLPEYTTMPI